MCLYFFALRIEPTRLVATEIPDRAAAASLDAGEPVLYGTDEDLHSVARRLRLRLVTVARTRTPRRPKFDTDAGAESGWRWAPKVLAEVA